MKPQRIWPVEIAIGIYCFWGLLLIAQKPGLQYDEALLVAGAVHMLHSPAVFEVQRTPYAWPCLFGRCIPLMSAFYVGSVKEYASLPLFALFGPRTPLIRLVSLLLGCIGIWGVYRLTAEWFSRQAAVLAAYLIAMNPTFVNMTVFDNNAVAPVTAGLGLACAGIALYRRRKSLWAAFALGLALGFSVWARANVVWILVPASVAALMVFRRRILMPAWHWAVLIAGGICGGFPFLAYQVLSDAATWRVQKALSVTTPVAALLRYRVFLFEDMLLSDGELRKMWAGPPLPVWQMWLFPAVVMLACLVCLLWGRDEDPGRSRFTQFLALTFLLTGAVFLFSRSQIAEHHLIMLLPLAVVVVVLACSILQPKLPWGAAISTGLILIYCSSAIFWQVAAIRGLKDTGGIGVWSDSGAQLARYLDRNFRGREVRFLDWGLQYNMYVLTGGRMKSREIYSGPSEELTFAGRPWIDEIREGGVFVLNGPENRQFPKPSAGFLRALDAARPEMRTYSVPQRTGPAFAEVIEIKPDSIGGPANAGETPAERISMRDPHAGSRLTGFYPPEGGGFRWTKREFSALLGVPQPNAKGAQLVVQLYIPDSVIQKLGPLTLRAHLGPHALAPETWSQPGQYFYSRKLEPDWIASGSILVEFTLDKSLPPAGADRRDLGIVIREIAIEPR